MAILRVELTKEMSRRIFRERTRLGISQKELGDLIGESYMQIHKYETNVLKKIKVASLSRLAQAMKVDIRYLLCEDMVDYISEINSEIVNLSQKDLAKVYNLIKQYKFLKGLV